MARRSALPSVGQVRALVSRLQQKLTTANLKLFTHECATKSAENRTMDANVRGEETNYQRSRLHRVYDPEGAKSGGGRAVTGRRGPRVSQITRGLSKSNKTAVSEMIPANRKESLNKLSI